MFDINVNVVSFEEFLAEDTASLAHKGHSRKNGDAKADDLDGEHNGKGSDKDDVVEKSDKAAPGDATADKVEGDGIKDGSDTAEEVKKTANAASGDDKGETLSEVK